MLAKTTVWNQPEIGLTTGLGQRLFATDIGEFGLLETRRIEIGDRPATLEDVAPDAENVAASAALQLDAGRAIAAMTAMPGLPGANKDG